MKLFCNQKERRAIKNQMLSLCKEAADWQEAIELLGEKYSPKHNDLILLVVEDFFFTKKN